MEFDYYIGQDMNETLKNKLEVEYYDMKIKYIKFGDMETADYNTNRIKVYYDDADKIVDLVNG